MLIVNFLSEYVVLNDITVLRVSFIRKKGRNAVQAAKRKVKMQNTLLQLNILHKLLPESCIYLLAFNFKIDLLFYTIVPLQKRECKNRMALACFCVLWLVALNLYCA